LTILPYFVEFKNFALSLLQFSKNFGKISDFLEFQKFQTPNTNEIAKDKKVNTADN